MKDEEKKALVGFHSFTGNDYIPSIFRKGKNTVGQQRRVMRGS